MSNIFPKKTLQWLETEKFNQNHAGSCFYFIGYNSFLKLRRAAI